MGKYDKVINYMSENNVDITKLYIYSCIPTNLEEKQEILETIYDIWLDIDEDICLARLCDVIVDHWEEIKQETYNIDDVILDLF